MKEVIGYDPLASHRHMHRWTKVQHTHKHTHTFTNPHCYPQVSERTGHQSSKPEAAVPRAWIYFPQDYTLTAGETRTHCASFHTRRNVIIKEPLYRVTQVWSRIVQSITIHILVSKMTQNECLSSTTCMLKGLVKGILSHFGNTLICFLPKSSMRVWNPLSCLYSSLLA